MTGKKAWFVMSILLTMSVGVASGQHKAYFDLSRSVGTWQGNSSEKWSEEFRKKVLVIRSTSENAELKLIPAQDSVPWIRARYLVCEVYHSSEHTLQLTVCFFRKKAEKEGEKSGKPWLTCSIGVLPKLKTQVIFPLAYLSNQTIFLPRFPRQLKGVVSGNRLDPADIEGASLRFWPSLEPHFSPTVELASVYLTDTLPENYPAPTHKYVDQFGQWTGRDWKGKIKDEKQLDKNIRSVEQSVAHAEFPVEWSRYGGLRALQFGSSGFFRVHHDGKRWWFVDPDGCAFLSTGVNCVTSSQSAVYNDMEDLLEWMPEKTGKFASIYTTQGPLRRIDYFKANQIRVYGDQWLDRWKLSTPKMMKQWRFNTVGNWSDAGFGKESGLAYVYHMNDFPATEMNLFRDFPDVYSPDYRKGAVRYARQLLPLKDDKRLLGYFLCNEPKWAFGDNVLAYEMFATNALSYTKLRFVSWLEDKYHNQVDDFNKVWNVAYGRVNELVLQTFKNYPSEGAKKDFREFTTLMVDEYIRVVCEEVKKADPNHLNLGMRYAWISSDALLKPARYFDVVSMSAYTSPFPPPTEEIAKISGRPVLLSEWHFGAALDGGLPSSGLQTTISQEERGSSFRTYAENGFSRPEVIGMHWFQWTDQPLLGRRDGENYNIGLLDACSLPYKALVESARRSHERMYDLATGKVKPYFFKRSPVPEVKAQE